MDFFGHSARESFDPNFFDVRKERFFVVVGEGVCFVDVSTHFGVVVIVHVDGVDE